jgi:PPOX class probable F420-dependent enzyme
LTTQRGDLTTEFLKSHRLAVLATGRRDGSPQQALIAYMFDGKEFAIRTSDASAKAKNIRKRGKVSLSVTDGPKAVVVYGSARLVEGADAAPYLDRMAQQTRPAGGGSAPARPARPQTGNTLVILVSPEKYMSARLEG